MIWAVTQQVGTQAIRYIAFLCIAGMLSPLEYGVFGIALLCVAFESVFSDLGFGAALVQRQDLHTDHLSSIFFLNVGTGLVLTAGGVLVSNLFSRMYRTPEAGPILMVLSLRFLIEAFSLTPLALAQRDLRFRDLALRDIVSGIAGGIVGVLMARADWSSWSLVGQSLTTSVVGAILIWRLTLWRPAIRQASLARLKELWPFGSRMLLFGVFKYFTQNMDRLLIGFYWGAQTLGSYSFAYTVVLNPVSLLTGAIGAYLFPSFSKLQHDIAAIRAQYLQVLQATSLLVLPFSTVSIVFAPTLLSVLFGGRWREAIVLVQLLSLVALIQVVISPVGANEGVKPTARLINWSVFFVVVMAGFLWLGSKQGISGEGLAILFAHLVALPAVSYMARRLIALRIRPLIQGLLPIWGAGIAAGITAWLGMRQLMVESMSAVAAWVCVCVGMFIGFLILFDKSYWPISLRKINEILK